MVLNNIYKNNIFPKFPIFLIFIIFLILLLFYFNIERPVICESIFVGIYSLSIFFILHMVGLINQTSLILLFFITGFVKHFLAYWFRLHDLYCVYGKACREIDLYEKAKPDYLFLYSLVEGVLFILVGLLINSLVNNPAVTIFFTGFTLHLVFEILGLHKRFCKNNCVRL